MRHCQRGLFTLVVGTLLVTYMGSFKAVAAAGPAHVAAGSPAVAALSQVTAAEGKPSPAAHGASQARSGLRPAVIPVSRAEPRCADSPGGHYRVCTRAAAPTPGQLAQLHRASRVHNVVAPHAEPSDSVPLPDLCWLFPQHGWVVFRNDACLVEERTGLIRDKDKGDAVVGTIDYALVEYAYALGSANGWGFELGVLKQGGTGAGEFPAVLTAQGACLGSCEPPVFELPPQPVAEGAFTFGFQPFHADLAPGAVTRAQLYATFEFLFEIPGKASIPIPVAAEDPPEVRCDDALFSYSYPGCVFPDFTPVMTYDLSGDFPELARHILLAQQSGLPGAADVPSKPLHRLMDKAKQNENRDRSCPAESSGGYPRPPSGTKSCDEYPFASTKEGASTQNPRGPARTFDGCQINEPRASGPEGYSVCMIDAWQNSVGGSALGTFYSRNRVLDGDAFEVFINTGAGGGQPHPPDYPPVVNAGPDVNVDEGSAAELRGSVTDDSEQPPVVRWTYAAGEDVDNGARCHFSDASMADTTISCTDDGTFTVTLSADDGYHDSPSTDSAVVHVANVPPLIRKATFLAALPDPGPEPALGIVAPQPWQLFRVGEPVTLTTNFTDPGSNDTHTCDISWDDGTMSSGGSAGYVCGGTHTYNHAGMYTIKPTITDDDAGVAEPASVMVVVYDPAGGWANADGSYNSPTGALASSPDTSGEGWFHLTGRYYPQNDPSRPLGAARSWLPDTGYRFDTDSSTLDWLVVTPDGKVAAKGSGTLAGHSGRYGFVFYAYDGCAAAGTPGACQPGGDRFRAVVWPLSASPYPAGQTVYDNRTGAGYDVDEAEPAGLRTGAVLIQWPR